MLEEREAWMERRASFTTLYVDTRTPPRACGTPRDLLVVPPGAALVGYGFNLIVAPISVQRDHKTWLEDALTRLLPGGKLVLVDEQ